MPILPEKLSLDRFSYLLALGSLIFSFFFFVGCSGDPGMSLTAALMTAALVWMSYIILRWLYLSLR